MSFLLKGLLGVALLLFSGWFGEFSFFISLCRVLQDTLQAGCLRAYPIISPPIGSPQFSWWYGISWRVHFSIGAPVEFVAIAFVLLVLWGWVFFELFREGIRSTRIITRTRAQARQNLQTVFMVTSIVR